MDASTEVVMACTHCKFSKQLIHQRPLAMRSQAPMAPTAPPAAIQHDQNLSMNQPGPQYAIRPLVPNGF